MAGDTKERILETALELFAQNGYLGTSMNDIAQQLGFTKAALYKHYTSKQEILDRIVERMNEMDYERAESYEMPETEPDGLAEAYLHTPIQKIRAYSIIGARSESLENTGVSLILSNFASTQSASCLTAVSCNRNLGRRSQQITKYATG